MSNKAFLFPGQGSQFVGMLAELAKSYPTIQKTFTQASKILGYDLWKLSQQGPEEKLNQTEFTQPALLTAGVAIWRVWQESTEQVPIFFAGHSLGEYTALVCANSITFEDAVSIVADRGRFMQEAVPEGKGAMAAVIGLDDNVVTQLCLDVAQGKILAPANYNSLGQVVVAGETVAVEKFIIAAKEAGAKIAKLIPVSVPSHCKLMQGAALKLANRLVSVKIKAPTISVINNVDVADYSDPKQIKDALVRQLFNPVRWVEIIQKLVAEGVEQFIECGPGKVLAGLNRRIVKDVLTLSICTPQTLQSVLVED